ncbi:MAG: hypothetical protein UMV23_03145, partial [Halanaerobium sp.]|nr:hypothetical protein [Halanaerobium sp.]
MSILIKDVRYFPMTGEFAEHRGDILVEGDRIAGVGPDLADDISPDRIIDGQDKLAIPGLINTHT